LFLIITFLFFESSIFILRHMVFIFVLWMFFDFIYDNQGMIPGMEMLFPTVEHRFYVKHIYNNLKLNLKDLELKVALWKYAAVTTVREFEKRMQDMKDLDKEARKYLADIQPTQ